MNNFTKYYNWILFFILFFLINSVITVQVNAQPPNFTNQSVSIGWNEVEGFTFDANGTMYVWEKGGKVWIVDTNGIKLPTPLLDINDEVGNWRDHGLNGFALDPNFLTNGYFYLYYTVDRHHLINFGTGNYNPATNTYYQATIARVTRYTADSSTNFTSVIPASRLILLGEDKKSGIPVLHESHSGGMLVFGKDGTLLISTGDGASYNFVDGGNGGTYWSQALSDSIIRPKENIGAFRAQLVDCLNGKLLRIDPATGNGIESNPFYDVNSPRAAKSRVWVTGFRNPFRFCLRPGTGNTDPTAGDPGVFYLGDVGWNTWEDLNVIKEGGKNFGWPIFEGLTVHTGYNNLSKQNQDAPNPLFGTGGCTQQYFTFQQLIKQATLDSNVSFKNPCDTSQLIPDSISTFIHERPAVDWRHGFQSRTGIYNGVNAAEINLNDPGSPVPGPMFGGYASVGGVFYDDNRFPLPYQGAYFQGDYAVQFVRNFYFDSSNNPDSVGQFWDGMGSVVFIAVNPRTGCLQYVAYPNEIKAFCYTGIVNNPPAAVATADTVYGISPFTVNFDASLSSDPENQPLTYFWDFGDGNNSTVISPAHTFTAPAGVPTTYTVVLTVTDDTLQSSSDTLFIYINNTPPQVQIISFNDGDLFSMSHNTFLPLEANVTDPEHGPSQLFYEWRTFLHHNSHEHPEQSDTNKITTTVISPIGCDGNTYYYRIELTVTDAGGLSTTVESSVYPACDPPVAAFTATATQVCPGSQVDFTDMSSNLPDSLWWYFPGGNPTFATGSNPSVIYNIPGTYDVQLIAGSVRGIDTLVIPNYLTVFTPPSVQLGNDTSLCGNAFVLDAGNPGAVYLWNDSSSGQQLTVNSSGVYFVLVTDSNNCSSSDTVIINLYSIPAVTLDPIMPDSFCMDITPFNLTGGVPVGGSYSGNGISSGIFDPAVSGTGTHEIIYLYTDSNGCSNSDTTSVTVFDLPNVTLSPFVNDTLCIYSNAFTLSGGLPPGGIFSGNGVSANTFDPAVAGQGFHAIVYSFTDSNGCMNSASQFLFVDLCLGIENPYAAYELDIFPNPTMDEFEVIYQSKALNKLKIKILNTLGEVMIIEDVEATLFFRKTFDISAFAKGIYFLQLITDKQAILVKIAKK